MKRAIYIPSASLAVRRLRQYSARCGGSAMIEFVLSLPLLVLILALVLFIGSSFQNKYYAHSQVHYIAAREAANVDLSTVDQQNPTGQIDRVSGLDYEINRQSFEMNMLRYWSQLVIYDSDGGYNPVFQEILDRSGGLTHASDVNLEIEIDPVVDFTPQSRDTIAVNATASGGYWSFSQLNVAYLVRDAGLRGLDQDLSSGEYTVEDFTELLQSLYGRY